MAGKWRLFSNQLQPQSVLSRLKKRYRRLLGFVLGVLLVLTWTLPLAVHGNESTALQLALEGQQRYDAGEFVVAAQLWQQAAAAYERTGDRLGKTKSLINQAQALQDLGLYDAACDSLLHVFSVDSLQCHPNQINNLQVKLSQQADSLSLTEAIGLRSFGNILRLRGWLEESKTFLALSLQVAQGTPEEASTLLSLGNTERALGNRSRNRWDYEEIVEIIDRQSQQAALSPYVEALNFYQKAASAPNALPIIQVQAQLNCFSLLLEQQKWWNQQAERHFAAAQTKASRREETFLAQLQLQLLQKAQEIEQQLQINLVRLPLSRAAAYARINFAQNLIQLQQWEEAQSELETALKEARTLKDWRVEAYALGYLARTYHHRGQITRATELTQQALILAQEQSLTGDAREISYLWKFQLGQLLRERGDAQGAIAAYTSAFNTLQSLRNDLNVNNQSVQFSFSQQVKPVYLELADLLLGSKLTPDELSALVVFDSSLPQEKSVDKSANRLQLARRVIESLQLAELDNFFQDPCLEEADVAVQIDDLDERAAVVYPIVFQERLEVILSLPGQPLTEAVIPVDEQTVSQTLDTLYDNLDSSIAGYSARNILSTSNPEPEELEANLQTLLPVFTQLYNWLIRPFEAALAANQIQTLVFVTNGALQKIPLAALYDGKQYLIEKYGIALVPSLQLISPRSLEQQSLTILAAGVSEPVKVDGETLPALNYVPSELNQIQAVFPNSQKLLNQEFTVETLQNQIQSADFPVIHLATHAQFSSDPQKNFIVTGQGDSLNIDQLSDLLKTDSAIVPELLVLSACQTATGDEQAVLGLAGIALRSGARSTVATLWPVEDASTAKLMGWFYQALKQPGKKIDALRSAQLSLMESLKADPPFDSLRGMPAHPYYWAPYTIVGNWQ